MDNSTLCKILIILELKREETHGMGNLFVYVYMYMVKSPLTGRFYVYKGIIIPTWFPTFQPTGSMD